RAHGVLLGMWLRHHLLDTERVRRRQAPQALAPATGSGPRLSLQLTRLCDILFPFVLAAVGSAAGFAACAPGVRVAAPAPAPGAVVLDSAAMRPGRFDAGKMWTFDNPPLDYFQEAYGFRPDSAWLARARLGALRFATYCSASFVSPHGLVLTNHHCSRELTAAAGASSVSVQCGSLSEGAQSSAYTHRRYGDVRLVLVPELGMGFFGGDDDNFTYPRYDLDFSVYRVYDASGKPLETPSYFRWSSAGPSDGATGVVGGNAGSRRRRETVGTS